MFGRLILLALWGALAAPGVCAWVGATATEPANELCARLAESSQALAALSDPGLVRAEILNQLRQVPPVAWLDGYWATPVDLSSIVESAEGESTIRRGLPLVGVAFTAAELSATIGLPFVGDFTRLDAVAASRGGVFVVPTSTAEPVLIEYLPPAGDRDSCYFFCGDPAAWDFDGDGDPNPIDRDDDGDGVPDDLDAYPYWPDASDCECGRRAFVGFTGKFSRAVTSEVVEAFDRMPLGEEPAWSGDESAVPIEFVDAHAELCREPEADCPEPEDGALRYVGRDPDDCARLRFYCEAGFDAFFNECGCGCRLAK